MKSNLIMLCLLGLASTLNAQDPRERHYYYEILDPRHEPKPLVEGFARERVTENLNRGLTVTPARDGKGIYLSWRLLASDAPGTAFHVYREADGKARRLTKKPLTQTCDFMDVTPAEKASYWVEALVKGKKPALSEKREVILSELKPYTSIPLKESVKAGKIALADLNGDGVISDKDKYFAGSTLPKAYGGLASELKWKGFDLNVLFSYSLGRKMINVFRKGALNFNPTSLNGVFEDYRNVSFWEKEGDQSDYPVMSSIYYYYEGQFDGMIDSNIETVNFLRLKQLTVGYNLPTDWAKKCYLQGVRVFFTGENLFLWSNYSGLDPENVDVMDGIDRMQYYPSSRKITLGLTVKF